VDIALKS